MTLHHLEIFVAVCQEKTTHGAAKKLNLSQPAVSKGISELEKYYQVRLFERIRQRLYLTAAGEKMRIHALRVLETFHQMESEIYQEGQKQHIRIGASVSVGTRLLPPLLKKLGEYSEEITYEATVDNTSTIEHMVEEYALDMALVEGTVNSSDLVVRDMMEDELVIASRSGHPLSKKENITIQDLEKYPFISREGGSSARNQLEQYFVESGIKMVPIYSCSNTETMKQALLYTEGYAILSKMMVEQELKEGKLVALPLEQREFKRTIRLIYHKNKFLSPVMQIFLELLEEQIKNSSHDTISQNDQNGIHFMSAK